MKLQALVEAKVLLGDIAPNNPQFISHGANTAAAESAFPEILSQKAFYKGFGEEGEDMLAGGKHKEREEVLLQKHLLPLLMR